MATNAYKGREGQLLIGATSSATGVKFGAIQNFEFNVTRPEISFTHFDSSGWAQTFPGTARWTGSAQCIWLSTAATVNEQDTIRSALTGETRKFFTVSNSTGAGSQTFKSWGYISGWTLGSPEDAPQILNVTFVGDGKYTES